MATYTPTVSQVTRVPIGNAADADEVTDVTALENGNYSVLFTRTVPVTFGQGFEYYSQLFGMQGQALSQPTFIASAFPDGPPVGFTSGQSPLPDGGYVVYYENLQQSGGTLSSQAFASSGVEAENVTLDTTDYDARIYNRDSLSSTRLENGSLVQVEARFVQSYEDSTITYYFDIISSPALSTGFRIPVSTSQSRIDVISDAQTIALAGGGFVVAWTDADGGSQTLYTRVFSAAGQPLAPEQPISASPTDLNGQLTALTGGGYVATYTDDDGAGILAQRFDAQGQPIGSEILVSAVGAEARLDALVNGGFVVAFDAGADHLAAAFDAVGLPIGTTVIDSSSAYGTPDFVLGLPNGGYEVGYFDFTNTSGDVTVVTTTVALAPSNAGTSGPDLLTGTAGSDLLSGEAGNDTLRGAAGDDDLRGGLGNDDLNGGIGNDTVSGGDGNDTVVGADGNDALSGGSGEDQLFGQAGNDTIQAGLGNDKLFGDAGNDQLFGQAGNDTVFGGAGADTLRGDEGNDRLFGDAGMDTLRGGAGDDQLTGGADADVFVFGAADVGQDRILDFTLGADRLDLRGLGLYAEADALSAATSDAAGQVVITVGAVSLTLEHLSIAQLQAGGDFLV